MIRNFLVLALLAFTAACAQSPGSIAPVSMGSAFSSVPCNVAAADLQNERAALAALERTQNGAVAGDAIGVFLLGIPVSSLTGGDKAGEIGTSKGKVLALETRMKSC